MSKLAGDVAVVTGGGGGLGRAISLELASSGADIAVVDLNAEAAQATADEIEQKTGARALALAADVSRDEDVAAAISAALDRFGRLSVLVNNAGIAPRGSVVDLSLEDWDRTIATNLTGTFLLCRHTIPAMVAGGGGVVVNIASVNAVTATADYAAYCASKGAIVSLTQALAVDHGRQGIRAVAVAPGSVNTPLLDLYFDELGEPDARRQGAADASITGRFAAEPAEVARLVAFLASRDAEFITGSLHIIDGGLTAARRSPDE